MKTIVLKCKQNFYLIPLLFFIALLLTTCDKEPVKTYYKIKGFGYVFDTIKNVPLANATISISACVEGSSGLFGNSNPEIEYCKTDSNGYYEIHFMNRYGILKVEGYIIELDYYFVNGIGNAYIFGLNDEDISNAEKDILLDPILIPQ